MNISYNWLKDLIEIDLPPQDLAEKLTGVGLAVEGIHAHGDDSVFDIDLTSNRPDCLSHLGVAREVGAILKSELKPLKSRVEAVTVENETQNLVSIIDPELCHRFTARIIRNVKIAPSPEWLVQRLEAVGERSINNVADITNFVMHELGQPMHSFDLDKLAESRIVVRRAQSGEKIVTLDEVERVLDDTMLAICDAEKPIAVAGVMGGLDSSITEETSDVLLEVAYFDRANIRATSRSLKLSTEASHRFERGVDIENLIRASNRAAELICELAGGKAEEFVDVYPVKFSPKEIESKDVGYAVERLTGLTVETTEISRILSALGIAQKSENIFHAPSWRHDLSIEEDLVEEIARVVGYDKIGEELAPSQSAGEYQPTERRKKLMRQTLVNSGFDEAISYSFIDTKTDNAFDLTPNLADDRLDDKFVTLQHSIIEGAVRMRPSLLPGLLEAVHTNFRHQRRDIKLFEIGKVFAAPAKENDLPTERELFALVVSGGEMLENKAVPARELDFFDAKGALESALNSLNLPAIEFAASEAKHLRRGQTANILIDGQCVGTIGRISDEIASAYKFRQPVYAAEVDLQTLLAATQRDILYRPLPIYPAISRDASLLVDRSVSFTEIRRAITDQKFELCPTVEFVDIYEGKGVSDNERSITIRLEYRAAERTLIDEEVDAVHNQILGALASNLGAKQRSS